MAVPQDAWEDIAEQARRLSRVHLRALFDRDPRRFNALSFSDDDLLIDLSKEKLDAQALQALFRLAEAVGLEAERDRMFSGASVNRTERRAALHMALRGGADPDAAVDGITVQEAVLETRTRMLAFAESVRTGEYLTAGGEPFSDVVNIGIGGSDLGPAMATMALSPFADGPKLHFVSNIDGAHFGDLSRRLDPARTLVIVASKTFTTLETMTNAEAAHCWLQNAVGQKAGAHIAAVSSNIEETASFGIPANRVFGFWDWVGGRYSVWSSIGLPLAIAIGARHFEAFLEGAAAMDRHFRTAEMSRNLPILLALQTVWRRNGLGMPVAAVIPYDQRLSRFTAWLQQLDMESLGKSVTAAGDRVAQATGQVIFGEPGTNSQHSFFQLMHQGTDVIPVDFLLAAEPIDAPLDSHRILAASALAQSAALAFGRSADAIAAEMIAEGLGPAETTRLEPHRTFPGDRPSTMILFQRLDPRTLGRLLALYEHKTFALGRLWQINPFDQWGVELGKTLTGTVRAAMESGDSSDLDASTVGLIRRLKS